MAASGLSTNKVAWPREHDLNWPGQLLVLLKVKTGNFFPVVTFESFFDQMSTDRTSNTVFFFFFKSTSCVST